MKRLVAIFLATFLVVMCMAALSEVVTGPPVLIDGQKARTDIIVWLIGIINSAVLSLIGFVTERYVVPWLKEKRLTALAKELVRAAEARFGRKQGAEKLDQVLTWMDERKLKVNKDQVLQAVLAAWQDFDIMMIETGLKEPPNLPAA